MALLSSTVITINGNALKHYNTFSLNQDLGEHHTLNLFCNSYNINSFCKENGSTIEDLIGNVITIEITPLMQLDFYKELRFKGLVSGIKYKKGMHSGEGDLVIIQGKSPTILAEDGVHFTSYSEKSFVDIIKQNFSKYDTSKLTVNTDNSKLSNPVLYTVHNNESCFEFAKKLAARHGEWMYYNGEELFFGLNASAEDVEVELGRDLKEFGTTLSPIPQKFNYYTNDYLTNEVKEKETASINGSHPQIIEQLNTAADSIYPNETQIWLNTIDDTNTKSRLDNSIKVQKEALQANQLIISGTSDNPGIGLGIVVKINNQGAYRVVKVTHSYNSNGEYENIFEAINAQNQTYPKTNVHYFPIAHPQTAIVKENNDPDGLARIKVQFPWQQKDSLVTPWIRIVSPHGGGDKGFHFIPEVGEEVLIGFEGGHAERPYLMGSLYHGKAKPEEWKTDKNDVKAIRTRSGHTIELNDTKGEEKINIYDNEGSIITFDTKKKSLFINSAEDIEISAKNIKMIAEENIELQAQGDIKTASEGDTNILSQSNLQLQSTSDTAIKSNGKIEVEATTDATVKGMKTIVEGQTTAELNGAKTKVSGSAMAEVSGGIVKIN